MDIMQWESTPLTAASRAACLKGNRDEHTARVRKMIQLAFDGFKEPLESITKLIVSDIKEETNNDGRIENA